MKHCVENMDSNVTWTMLAGREEDGGRSFSSTDVRNGCMRDPLKATKNRDVQTLPELGNEGMTQASRGMFQSLEMIIMRQQIELDALRNKTPTSISPMLYMVPPSDSENDFGRCVQLLKEEVQKRKANEYAQSLKLHTLETSLKYLKEERHKESQEYVKANQLIETQEKKIVFYSKKTTKLQQDVEDVRKQLQQANKRCELVHQKFIKLKGVYEALLKTHQGKVDHPDIQDKCSLHTEELKRKYRVQGLSLKQETRRAEELLGILSIREREVEVASKTQEEDAERIESLKHTIQRQKILIRDLRERGRQVLLEVQTMKQNHERENANLQDENAYLSECLRVSRREVNNLFNKLQKENGFLRQRLETGTQLVVDQKKCTEQVLDMYYTLLKQQSQQQQEPNNLAPPLQVEEEISKVTNESNTPSPQDVSLSQQNEQSTNSEREEHDSLPSSKQLPNPPYSLVEIVVEQIAHR